MEVTQKHIERIRVMKFSSVYPHYLDKIEKKGRTVEELLQVMTWLTGYNEQQLHHFITSEDTFETFFKNATIHSNAHLIKGVICGYRIEEINHKLVKEVRYLDKLIDELAKGRKMEKILRTPK